MISRTRVVYFAVFALLSLGLKVLFDTPLIYNELHTTFLTGAKTALEKKDFQLMLQTDWRTVQAYRNGCFVWIGVADAAGGGDTAFSANYGGLGKLAYWYKGNLYETLPSAEVLTDRYLERVRTALGIEATPYPVFHIIYTSDCSDATIKGLDLWFGR